jgi:RND family efflux transporter MFP subunit
MTRLLLAATLLATTALCAAAEDVTLDCLADPAEVVAVGSPVTGIVREVLVGRGDRVAAGDVLARLDTTIEEADVAVAEAQADATEVVEAQRAKLLLAEANLQRALQLVESGSVTQSRVEELEAVVAVARSDLATETRRVDLARIELERARAVLSLRTLKSPLEGFVTAQGTAAGEFLRQDGIVFTVARTDPLHVETYAPVEYYGRLVLGSSGRVELNQPPGTTIEAKVTVNDAVFDAASNTFGLRLELPNPDNAIPAGQQCAVTFALP